MRTQRAFRKQLFVRLDDNAPRHLEIGRENPCRRQQRARLEPAGLDRAAQFEAALSQVAAHRRIIDELLSVFGGRTQPVMAHLIETGKLTLDDLREAEATLRRLSAQERKK